ncbi:hypothetical protein [Diaphorobacter caeni]|uniref:hypothetical protein n=1 Tax=Diaphorobacter caeni TaxID=2784387 RepID=UPI00188DDAB5|nr:hypothetical protein [Diaphorobacter caeni]MBF5006832.1 hypothetical protein [Diaphorobacter caeni]
MKINLSPQVRDDTLEVSRAGDALIINGATLDFTPLPEGAVLPGSAAGCEFIVGDVVRRDGQIELTLLLPIAWDAPHAAAFPQPIIDPPDGRVALPTDEVPQ